MEGLRSTKWKEPREYCLGGYMAVHCYCLFLIICSIQKDMIRDTVQNFSILIIVGLLQ